VSSASVYIDEDCDAGPTTAPEPSGKVGNSPIKVPKSQPVNGTAIKTAAYRAFANAISPAPLCKLCQVAKPKHISWDSHNTAPLHVANLCKRKADRITVYCELCFVKYPNALHYKLHLGSEQHLRRRVELLELVKIATEVKRIKPWIRVNTVKVTPDILKVLFKHE